MTIWKCDNLNYVLFDAYITPQHPKMPNIYKKLKWKIRSYSRSNGKIIHRILKGQTNLQRIYFLYFCTRPFFINSVQDLVSRRYEDAFLYHQIEWFQWIFSSLRMRVEYRCNTHVLPRAYTHVWVIWDLQSEKQHTVNTGMTLTVNFVSIHTHIIVFMIYD